MSASNGNDLKNLSAVWVIADRIEISIRDLDMERDEARGFEEKFRQALASRPKELVVRLEVAVLSTAALGVILRARADANREGVRFRLQPQSPRISRMVRDLGVDRILGLAA
jgi:anti-anti-sigma regulatory factor